MGDVKKCNQDNCLELWPCKFSEDAAGGEYVCKEPMSAYATYDTNQTQVCQNDGDMYLCEKKWDIQTAGIDGSDIALIGLLGLGVAGLGVGAVAWTLWQRNKTKNSESNPDKFSSAIDFNPVKYEQNLSGDGTITDGINNSGTYLDATSEAGIVAALQNDLNITREDAQRLFEIAKIPAIGENWALSSLRSEAVKIHDSIGRRNFGEKSLSQYEAALLYAKFLKSLNRDIRLEVSDMGNQLFKYAQRNKTNIEDSATAKAKEWKISFSNLPIADDLRTVLPDKRRWDDLVARSAGPSISSGRRPSMIGQEPVQRTSPLDLGDPRTFKGGRFLRGK